MEMLVVALVPPLLALMQTSRTIIPLLLLGWLSLWVRNKRWKEIGLNPPAKGWLNVVVAGSGVAIATAYLGEKVISPLLFRLTGETRPQVVELTSVRGNLSYFLLLLIAIWLLAAIGEELVYRGYVLNRIVDLLGHSKFGWGIGLILSSLMFSLGHGIFNRAIIIGDFLIGLLEGGLYLIGRRNLWLPIIFHGAWDTIFLTLYYLGISWRR